MPARVNAIICFVLVSTVFLYHVTLGEQTFHYHEPPALRGSLARRLHIVADTLSVYDTLRAAGTKKCDPPENNQSEVLLYFEGQCYDTVLKLCQQRICVTKSDGTLVMVSPHRRRLRPYEDTLLSDEVMLYVNAGSRLTVTGLVIFQMIFVACYWNKVVKLIPRLPQQPPSGTTEFKTGLCDCDDFNLCLHAWCCSMCRSAHTLHVTQGGDYWQAVIALFVATWCLTPCCGPLVLMTYWRMQTKRKLGIEPEIIGDCCLKFWCTFCTIQQEAAAVDDLSGVKVRCCCKIVRAATDPHGTHAVQMVTMQTPSQQPLVALQPVEGIAVQPSMAHPPMGQPSYVAPMAQPSYVMTASVQPGKVAASQQPSMMVHPSESLKHTMQPVQAVAVEQAPSAQLSITMMDPVQPPQVVAVQQPVLAQPPNVVTGAKQPHQAVAMLQAPTAPHSNVMTVFGQPVQVVASQQPSMSQQEASLPSTESSWKMIDGKSKQMTHIADGQFDQRVSAQPSALNEAGAAQPVIPLVAQALGQNKF